MSKIEGTVSETSKLYSKLREISELKDDKELHTRLLSSKGDLVAVEARYHRNKCSLASNIGDRNIRADKVLPKKGHLEEAGAILKDQLEKIETENCVFEMSYVKSLFAEICKANNIAASKTALKAKRVKQLLKEI